MRYNAENQSNASFECFKSGRLLPSNLALEMSFQYECVIAFGKIMVVHEIDEKKEILYGVFDIIIILFFFYNFFNPLYYF